MTAFAPLRRPPVPTAAGVDLRPHHAVGATTGPRLSGRHCATDGPATAGRRLIATNRQVPADYSPLDPATRQTIAPTWWANRLLSAGPMDHTGLMTAVTEVTR